LKLALIKGGYKTCESVVKLSNLYKIGKYDKEIGKKSGNSHSNDTTSTHVNR